LRARYRSALERLADEDPEPGPDAERIRQLFAEEGSPERFRQALEGIRFQLGQTDRFRAGLVRAGAWSDHIANVLAARGLPAEIAALPHVESSFDPTAYSKVGAAGLWQFMPATGRSYLRVDDAVDERMDPFRATEAAAQLLEYNHRLLGSWPLALTAYNHGAAGMRRARDAMGTDDIVTLIRQYQGPGFGFASRNFYPSFLAALEIDRKPEAYFGPLVRQAAATFPEVEMPVATGIALLLRALEVPRGRLRALNPALLSPVWSGKRPVPQGYRLRLPETAGAWTPETLAARLATLQAPTASTK
jgi:membrane-bound lytic murein transglycosylase D